MKYNNESIVGEVVADDYRTATVFKQLGVDFCCQGNRTIEDACNSHGVPISKVLGALDEVVSVSTKSDIDFASWPLDLLADYIEKKHHRYVEAKSVEIKPYLEKICAVHGKAHPELLKIKTEFEMSVGELARHMKREELMLFPYIRKMTQAKIKGKEKPAAVFGSVSDSVVQMQEEHNEEGERFRKISALSSNYTIPEDGCNTYKVTYAMLQEFEEDLHLHIHLENNILFPKSIALENNY